MWPTIQIQDGGRRHHKFYQQCDFGHQSVTLCTKLDTNTFIHDSRKYQSKMETAVLKFTKIGYLATVTLIATSYLHIKLTQISSLAIEI